MKNKTFPPVNPPFHFSGPPRDGRTYGRGIPVTTTADLHFHYHDKLNRELTWVKPGSCIGFIRYDETKVLAYHPAGPYLGECKSRWEAAEFLLNLYLAQNKPAT